MSSSQVSINESEKEFGKPRAYKNVSSSETGKSPPSPSDKQDNKKGLMERILKKFLL